MPPKKLKLPELVAEIPVPEVKPRTKKKLILPVSPRTVVIEDEPVCVDRIESTEDPIVVVKKVVMKPFTHNGKKYYIDSENHSLYSYIGPKQKGSYCGRWDILRSCIVVNAPESESEE
jgi:hypothetical protein